MGHSERMQLFSHNRKLPAYSGALILTIVLGSFLLSSGAFLLTVEACLLTIEALLLTMGVRVSDYPKEL